MRKYRALILLAVLLAAASIETRLGNSKAAGTTAAIPAPEDVLGFKPGDDRKLASWAKVVEYFQRLAATSDRVKFAELGKTTMGAPFVMATISAPENLARLDEFKDIQRQLADPRVLADGIADASVRDRLQAENSKYARQDWTQADRKAADLIKRGKTIVLITCGIHSDEVGSYLSSMLIANRLASSNEPDIQRVLHNTIILLVPSLNPDGVDIVKNWYDKTLGTPYEGTDPPELYHKYTGHDDNRDWYAFTQIETQLTVDKIHNVWHPQIVHDIHQQGEYGSRLFLPPYMQPVEPNVPKQIVEGYTELGNYIAKEMRGEGFKGITTDSTYDAWSPSRAYSHYHGGVRMLSETASCKIATPITVKFEELRAGQNYDPRKEAPNFGPVWPGGEWHLRDITNHMTTAAFLLLKHAAENREHWLQGFYEIGKEAVRPRLEGEAFGFILPTPPSRGNSNTFTLREIFQRAGVEITETDKGWLVRNDQPYGGFARALMVAQQYPNLRDPAGNPIPPYDVTAQTLTLLMDVTAKSVSVPFTYNLRRYSWGGTIYGYCTEANERLAIYKSSLPVIDEGWTRWLLERKTSTTCLKPTVLTDAETRRGSLRAKYDTIVIPDQSRNAILNGYRPGAMPPEYTGGFGAEGVKELRQFVEQGGTLVCLNRASDFAIEQFGLPLRDAVEGLPRADYYVPGSILRIELETSNPLTTGMPKESIAWAENSPAFEVIEKPVGGTPAVPVANVHVIAWYPKDKDPLLSGWLLGGERIKGKAALVEVTMGKGRIILFGFRPQYRGQSLATYPLFFNAIAARSN